MKYNNKNKEYYKISFDLGTNSIGSTVIGVDNQSIWNQNVIILPGEDKAAERGVNRRNKRIKSRKKTRREDLIKVFKKNRISFKINQTDNNLIEKRIYGLNNILNDTDLFNILNYLISNRGYIPFASEDELELNPFIEDNKNKFPCEISKLYLKEKGSYKKGDLIFQNSHIRRELVQLLNNQKYDETFNNEILNIFDRKRKFQDGPGSQTVNTKYGLFNGSEKKQTLWETNIGKCSLYYDEVRFPKSSYEAEKFNILNDFINISFRLDNEPNLIYFKAITIKNEQLYKLTKLGLETIIEYMENCKTFSLKRDFKKLFNVEVDQNNLIGNRIDANGKLVLSKFGLTKKLKSLGFDHFKIEYIITNLVLFGDLENSLIEFVSNDILTEKEIDLIKENKIKIPSDKSGYHSYSKKALTNLTNLMLEYQLNSEKIKKEFPDEIKADKEQRILNKLSNQLNHQYINELGARSSVNKKILNKVINEINFYTNKYGLKYLEEIVVEGNNSFLSQKQKNEVNTKNGDNKKINDDVKTYLLNNNIEVTQNNILKQKLLNETNSHCIYCSKEITINNMEIEHIYPISRSNDDSFNNKVASCQSCNKIKNNKLPLEFISNKEEWTSKIKSNKKLSNYKKEQLLLHSNEKQDIQFKARQLNDTMGITKDIVTILKWYKKKNDLEFTTLKVPSSITFKYRQELGLEKDRNLDYHHVVDSCIVALFSFSQLADYMRIIQNDRSKFWWVMNSSQDISNIIKYSRVSKEHKKVLENINFTNINYYKAKTQKITGQKTSEDIIKVKEIDNQYYQLAKVDFLYTENEEEIKKLILILLGDEKSKPKVINSFNNSIREQLIMLAKSYNGKDNPFITTKKYNRNNQGYLIIDGVNINKFYYLKSIGNLKQYDYKNNNKKDTTLLTKKTFVTSHFKLYEREDNSHFIIPMYKIDQHKNLVNEEIDKLITKQIHKNQNYKFIKDINIGDMFTVLDLKNGIIYKDMRFSSARRGKPSSVFSSKYKQDKTLSKFKIISKL